MILIQVSDILYQLLLIMMLVEGTIQRKLLWNVSAFLSTVYIRVHLYIFHAVFENCKFQLFLSGLIDCPQWVVSCRISYLHMYANVPLSITRTIPTSHIHNCMHLSMFMHFSLYYYSSITQKLNSNLCHTVSQWILIPDANVASLPCLSSLMILSVTLPT